MIVEFQAELWRWPGDAALHHPPDRRVGRDSGPHVASTGRIRIRSCPGDDRAVDVAHVGLPGRASGAYLLPMKAAVRHTGDVEVGDDTAVTIEVLDGPANGPTDGTPARRKSRTGQVSGGHG